MPSKFRVRESIAATQSRDPPKLIFIGSRDSCESTRKSEDGHPIKKINGVEMVCVSAGSKSVVSYPDSPYEGVLLRTKAERLKAAGARAGK